MNVKSKVNRWLGRFSVFALAAIVAACASDRPAPDSLYTRLGGMPTIDGLAQEFSVRMLEDPRLESYLRGVGEADFKDTMKRHLCSVARGPCRSIGRNLKFYLEKRGIEGDDFSIALAHLSGAMTSTRLPANEQAELHTRLLGECGRKKRRGC